MKAVEEEGSRPPGLLVVGWSCEVLKKLNRGMKWSTEDGFRGLDGLGFEEGIDGLKQDMKDPHVPEPVQMTGVEAC